MHLHLNRVQKDLSFAVNNHYPINKLHSTLLKLNNFFNTL
jgi:ABC-type uncharacterized transport system fused permease/ATPase subunit